MSTRRWFLRWAVRAAWIATAALMLPSSVAQTAPTTAKTRYNEMRQKTREAFQRKDNKAVLDALLQLREDFPGRSAIPEELAQAEARMGNDDAALDWLRQSVEMGLVPKLDDAAFETMRKSGKLNSLRKQVNDNRKSVSHSTGIFRFGAPDLLAEDVAYDAKRRRFLASSVRQRKIASCDFGGKCEDFITAKDVTPSRLWAVFALGIDPAGGYLWATTASVPFESGHDKEDEGRCALLKFELSNRKLLKRYECEATARHEMGDMTVARDGTVFVADGGSGDVFVLRRGAQRLERLVPAGTFVSPQTPALSADGKLLYVPDYVAGIAAMRLSDGKVEWLKSKSPAALDGIDGLYAKGKQLIAIQNGTTPERIVTLYLSGPTEVDRWEVLEANWEGLGDPTHGLLLGDDFYFVANSGWDRVGRDGTIAPGKPAEVRRLNLTAP